MRKLPRLVAFGATMFFAIAAASAEPKIDQEAIGPSGQWAGYALSPQGVHAAVMQSKGSRFIVSVDGVDGPRIDQMLGFDGSLFMTGNSTSNISGGTLPIPVLFSSDGAHYAYFAKVGDEYILVLDGKELVRGKFQASSFRDGPLAFSAGGKHLYFGEPAPTGGYHIVVDGQPGPSSHTPPKIVTSPDGAHYAYTGTQADGLDTPWAVVDGKQVKYFGGDLQFSAKGHLFALLKDKTEMALNVDGHNAIVANSITQVHISPGGGEIAAMVYIAKTNQTMLTVNGKPVPSANGMLLQNVYFSPDDKHYAAVCNAAGSGVYVILDGKKGQRYDALGSDVVGTNSNAMARAWAAGHAPGTQIMLDNVATTIPGFTADSANFLYIAMVAGKSFLVTNEDESDGYQAIGTAVSPDGKHIALIGNMGSGKMATIIDGKPVALKGRAGPPTGGTASLTFSPDSAHWIYVNSTVVYLDGVEQPGIVCQGRYLFSPDSQHVLLVGSSVANAARSGLFLDGKLVTTGSGVSNPVRPIFSPDSKHVFWIGHRPPETSTDYDSAVLYVDGSPTSVHFIESDANQPGNWEVSADGVLTFVARSAGDLKRFRITPGADTNLASMLAGAKDAAGK